MQTKMLFVDRRIFVAWASGWLQLPQDIDDRLRELFAAELALAIQEARAQNERTF